MSLFKSKARLLIPLLLIVFALTGCSSTKYQDAVAKMEQGDYQAALSIFDSISNYKDASGKADECRYELGSDAVAAGEWDTAINYLTDLDYKNSPDLLAQAMDAKGMSENADNDFLSALESAVIDRINSVNTENYDNKTIVNAELAYVEKYKDATFYDENLKSLASKYIDGLNTQKDALKNGESSELQIEWQRGIVSRYEVLRDLYEQYDFLSNNTDFVAIYVSSCDDQKALLNAYEALDADIEKQMSADDFQWFIRGNEVYWTLKNNTDYSFSTTFNIVLYGADDVRFDESSDYIENISADSSYTVSFYVGSPNQISSFDWSNYYDAVILP